MQLVECELPRSEHGASGVELSLPSSYPSETTSTSHLLDRLARALHLATSNPSDGDGPWVLRISGRALVFLQLGSIFRFQFSFCFVLICCQLVVEHRSQLEISVVVLPLLRLGNDDKVAPGSAEQLFCAPLASCYLVFPALCCCCFGYPFIDAGNFCNDFENKTAK